MNKVKLISILLIVVSMSGCCMKYKKYFKRVDAISMEFKDMQKDLSGIGKKSREMDSILSSGQTGIEETILKIDSIEKDISGMKNRMSDIYRAIRVTKKPCDKILKSYHKTLMDLLLTLSEDSGRHIVFPDDPIKIEIEDELKNITMEKLKEYETFLPDIVQISNYFMSLNTFYRSCKFRILEKNFYAYSLKPYSYKDKKNKTIYTYIVKKREIIQKDIDIGYIEKLRKKILDYEEKIKGLISDLIKTRDDFKLFIAAKKAGKK